jgi:hypothetical protein
VEIIDEYVLQLQKLQTRNYDKLPSTEKSYFHVFLSRLFPIDIRPNHLPDLLTLNLNANEKFIKKAISKPLKNQEVL